MWDLTCIPSEVRNNSSVSPSGDPTLARSCPLTLVLGLITLVRLWFNSALVSGTITAPILFSLEPEGTAISEDRCVTEVTGNRSRFGLIIVDSPPDYYLYLGWVL